MHACHYNLTQGHRKREQEFLKERKQWRERVVELETQLKKYEDEISLMDVQILTTTNPIDTPTQPIDPDLQVLGQCL